MTNELLPPIRDALKLYLPLLEEGNFRLWNQEYDSRAFGNFQLVMFNNKLKIRFTRDRGQVFVEYASEEGWLTLSSLGELTKQINATYTL